MNDPLPAARFKVLEPGVAPVPETVLLSASATAAFDLVRFAAAQFVVFGHTIGLYGVIGFLQPPEFAYIQNIGVVVFFFISGMLVTNTVVNNRRFKGESYGFGRYIFDRATRIFAGLVPALFLIAVIDAVFIGLYPDEYGKHARFYDIAHFVGNLAFLQDYPIWDAGMFEIRLTPLEISSFGTGRPLWTLAIEWWLYVGFGALILAWPRAWVGRAAVALLVILALPVIFLNTIEGRGDGLAMVWLTGVGAILLLRQGFFEHVAPVALFGAFVVFALWSGFLVDDMRDGLKGYDLHANLMFSFAAFLFILFTQRLKRDYLGPRTRGAIRFLAAYSYTAYLTHYTIILFFWAAVGRHHEPHLMAVISILLANIIACAMAMVTEMRYKDLRNALWPDR